MAALEERGWRALSSDGATAAAFYEQVLDREVVMLLPGGLTLSDRNLIVESMSGQPWTTFRLDNVHVLRPTPDTGVVTYGVVARREPQPEYSALVSSLYVWRDDGWKMACHQQTPR